MLSEILCAQCTKKSVLLEVCIFEYFTGKIWQNDQNGILTARKQTHVPFSLSFCHISSPNLMSQNFCFSSSLLLVLSSLWAVSQNSHLSQHSALVAFSVSVLKVFSSSSTPSDSLQTRLSPVCSFLFGWFCFCVCFFLLAVVPWDNFSCCVDAMRSCLELKEKQTLAAKSGR